MTDAAQILELNEDNLTRCASLLREDRLVAVPTETVYGLAGNSLSEHAAHQIFTVKGRPLIDPLISHFYDTAAAFSHVRANADARRLADAFWPGPLTLVLPKGPRIPDLVTAGLPSAAVRVPAHPAMRRLLARIDFPLAAPSANPFGYVSPTRAEHVATTLGSRLAAILDAGPCQHGIESTIVDLREQGNAKLLRPGPIDTDALEATLGQPVAGSSGPATGDRSAQTAPGMLSKHYSPNATIEIRPHGAPLASPKPDDQNPATALIFNQRPTPMPASKEPVFWLSEGGNLSEIGQNFFHLLQQCDQMGCTRLIVEAAPEGGVGTAINDRLRRAAAKPTNDPHDRQDEYH